MRKMIALCLALAFIPFGLSAQQFQSIKADFVHLQKGAPLQVLGTTMSFEDLYKRVFIANTSSEKIVRAQLGWTLGSGRQGNEVLVFFGPQTDVNLAAGEIKALGAQGATRTLTEETLAKMKYPRGVLRIGVIYAKFESGREWSYDLQNQKLFIEFADPEVSKRITPKWREFRQKNFPELIPTAANSCSPPLPKRNQVYGRDLPNSLFLRFMPKGEGLFLCAVLLPAFVLTGQVNALAIFAIPFIHAITNAVC